MKKISRFILGVFLLGSLSLLAETQHAEDIKDLQAQIGELKDELRHSVKQLKSSSNQARANTFNPGLTVFGNFLGCGNITYPKSSHSHAHDHDHHHHEHEAAHTHAHSHPACSNSFILREVELDLRATIDPWADGVVIVAFESHDGAFEVDVEEAFFTLKQLPVLNSSPWGLKIKLGRFRPEFGRFNKIHTHDLPQSTYPLVIRRFMGDHGFMQNGASADFIIPTWGESNALSVNLAVLNKGGLAFQGAEPEQAWPSGVGHVSWFWDLATGHDLDFGASTYLSQSQLTDKDINLLQLYGFDFTYKFKESQWKSFLLGGEFMIASNGEKSDISWPWGMFAWTQYQLTSGSYLGLRYSFSEALKDSQHIEHAVSAWYSFYTTEFLRVRFGYEHIFEEVGHDTWGNQDVFMIEFNFIFGSHPVEPYWVNL